VGEFQHANPISGTKFSMWGTSDNNNDLSFPMFSLFQQVLT